MHSVHLRFLFLPFVAFSAATVAWSLWHQRPVERHADNQAGDAAEAVVRDEQGATPTASVWRKPPALAKVALDQDVPALAASPSPESNDESTSEIAAANARAAMADFWKLTAEQVRAFDTASAAPAQARMDVMLRFAEGKVAKKDFSAEMQAAERRGLERVRDVLGDERFNEYLSIRARLEGDEPDMSPSPYTDNYL
jgi:hypothetical protein